MKKIIILIVCILLVGCDVEQIMPQSSSKPNDESNVVYKQWLREFVRDDGVIVSFHREGLEDENMLEFRIELGVKGFGEFAYLQKDKNYAIYDSGEDGYTLEFILKDDKLIIKESHGISYLHTNLSGEYKIKGG
ncbi:MAG: hypothetical protein HFF37_01680 [Coprobacillus sp.]|nr:hypothetical protein [Coprobacillus sp.]